MELEEGLFLVIVSSMLQAEAIATINRPTEGSYGALESER